MIERNARRLALLAALALGPFLPGRAWGQAAGAKPAPAAAKPAPANSTAARAPAPVVEDPNAALLKRAGQSRARGSKEAAVTVYEVADFQCPFCAQFANETFARIDSGYIKPGRVQWVYVNMPLVIHPNAFQAAEAALCAGAVADRFWPM
ncbi:MAG TPA: thioredoxin domain-containing protein, partial [Longimicrobiales bacterium]